MRQTSVLSRSTFFLSAIFATTILAPSSASAWGRRGHVTVAVTAAHLGADTKTEAAFLRNHAFDLGYYSNVPDLVWKKPETYQTEWVQHFMDLEIFTRQTKDSTIQKPFQLSRAEFETAFPKIEPTAGRAYWRIRELMERLDGIATELKKRELAKERRHQLQADWLVTAGVIGHYVGDLAQPLHTTENYDGQLTGQKGIHAFFEDEVIDSFASGELESEVDQAAKRQEKAFFKTSGNRTILELLESLTAESNAEVVSLLKIDKKVGREDMKKARAAYRKMIVERMARGSLVLSEFWMRSTGWSYNGDRFYTFISTPEFIAPAPGATKKESTTKP